MLTKFLNLLNKIGIDSAVLYTILARIIQGVGGMISIIFIANYLSKVEQGYFYTFGSILAVQVFFELGLSGIIVQFVAHEFASLKWSTNIQLEGSKEVISRLSSLLHFCVKWFAAVALLLFILLLFVGYFFFNKYGIVDNSVNWIYPWIIISLSTACSLTASPVLSFLEGLGKVKDVAKIRFIQQICQIFVLFICLISGLKLFSSPIASLITFLIVPTYILFSNYKLLLYSIWKQLNVWKVNYKLEIFPFQWRIALSWISGYFMYQLFNPVIFATEGAVVAGQMGITLAVLNGILTISLSWINTKIPLFTGLIAKKEYETLDLVFNKTVKQASGISFFCLTFFVFSVIFMRYIELKLGDRFLPMLPLVLLSFTTFVNQFVSALATYLRCHKKEPFLIFSIVLGGLTAASTLIFGKFFGVLGITIGYSVLTILLSLTWAVIIFKKKKSLWHKIE